MGESLRRKRWAVHFAIALWATAHLLICSSVAIADTSDCIRYAVSRIAKKNPRSDFDKKRFLRNLSETEFRDNKGDPFYFDPSDMASVKHSKHGTIAASDGSFVGREVDDKGNLNWTDSYTNYGPFKDLGLTSQLFGFFRSQLPNGAHLYLMDATDSKAFSNYLVEKVSGRDLRHLIETDPKLSQVWKIYSRMIAQPEFRRDYSSSEFSQGIRWYRLHEEERKLFGFRLYLSDISSQWGRIARKGDFRRDYAGPGAFHRYLRIKREIPADLKEEEDQAIQSVPGGNMTEYLQKLFKFH